MRMGMSSVIPVKDFLLDKGKFKGYSAQLIGNYFQRKLRQEIRGESYKCPVCKGYGFLLTKGSQKEMIKDLDILSDLAGAGVAEALGLPGAKKKDGSGYLSGATIAYKQIPMFKKTNGIKGILIKHRKNTKKNLKKDRTVFDDVEVAKETYKHLENIAKSYVGPCPYCAGNGYLDVGHKSLEGKTIQLLLWVFTEYAQNGKQKVQVKTLYNEFKKYPIEPQWAISPGLDPYGLSYFTDVKLVNRYSEYTNAMSRAKTQLIKRFEEFYEKGGGDLKEEDVLTYKAVSSFYPLLKQSRVNTGTLREFISKEQTKFEQEFQAAKARFQKVSAVTHVINPKTKDVEIRLPVSTYFFRGPTKHERGKFSKNEQSRLYIYAGMYSDFNGHDVRWSKNTGLLSTEAAKFFTKKQMSLLRFFPQEYN